jgi:hypothetical protein
MSITIEISGKQAVLASGKWRSADKMLQQLLNSHLAIIEVPAHLPPSSCERLAAEAAVQDLGATITAVRPIRDDDSGFLPDGRQKVY